MREVQLSQIPHGIIGIYKLNFPNGKSYIGQSVNIKKRVQEHNQRARKIDSDREIQVCEKAIRKYGEIDTFIILEEGLDKEQLDKKEKYWISYYNTTNKNFGYNLLDYGDVSGRRDFDHYNSSVSEELLEEIILTILNNPKKSLKQIGIEYGLSQNIMVKINQGRGYINQKYQYPLRDSSLKDYAKKDFEDYFETEKDILILKDAILYNWWLSLEEDIPKQFNLPKKIVRGINHGILFSEYGDYSYPIRGKNVRPNGLTKADIENILDQLKNTSLSMTAIGKQYNRGRDFISNVNQGKSLPIKDYKYPARS